MDNIKNDFNLIKNKKVIHSESGGTYGSRIVIIFENKCKLWARRTWEITKGGRLIACSGNDTTATTGVIAVTVHQLEGTVLNDLYFDNTDNQLGMLFDNGFELRLYPEYEERDEFKSVCNWMYRIPTKNLFYVLTSQLEIKAVKYDQHKTGVCRMLLDNNIDNLKNDIKLLIDKKVTYSRTGGGVSSILLIIFDNECAVWAWRYWELTKDSQLIACSEDDDTPITGLMAVTAHQLEGAVLEDFYLDDTDYQLGMLFDNGYELRLYPELEECEEFKDLNNWEYTIPTKNICYVITSQLKIKSTKYYE